MANQNLVRQDVDQILDARWIVPIEPAGCVLENHSLVIQRDRILAILPTVECQQRYATRRRFDLGRHILMPGLINLHTHAAMTLLRGYADDMPLMRWLQDYIWPAENRCVSPKFVHDGTLLACWEMLRGGITCFNDMYFFPESAATAALKAGMRAALGITVFEFPSPYGSGPEDYIAKGLASRDQFADNPLISFCLAPHAPYTVADKTFSRVAYLGEQLGLPVHIHLHETLDEINGSLKEHGVRPLARLTRLGLLNERMIAVHAVHLASGEIEQMAAAGSHVAHCPSSNLKLASGIAPVPSILSSGISVGLGTDGAASNNRLDLFQEMRLTALLAKVSAQDASCLPHHQALGMATLEGAKALGLDKNIGSLLPGKLADVIAIELDDWHYQPCFDPASHLVYVAGREAVSHVWVGGKARIDAKKPLDLDIPALRNETNIWQNAMQSLGSPGA